MSVDTSKEAVERQALRLEGKIAWQPGMQAVAALTLRDLAAERDALLEQVKQAPHPCSPHCAGYLRQQETEADRNRLAAESEARGMEWAISIAIEYGHTDDGDVFRIVEMIVNAIRAAAKERQA